MMTGMTGTSVHFGVRNGKSVLQRLKEAQQAESRDRLAQIANANRLQEQVDEIVFESNKANLTKVLGGIKVVSSGLPLNGLELLQLIDETIKTTPKNRGGSANKCYRSVLGNFEGKESEKCMNALKEMEKAGLVTLPKSGRSHTGGDIYLTELGEITLEKLKL